MLFIRADSNNVISGGHIMRCMAIAKAMKKLGEKVCFLTADDNPSQVLSDAGMERIVLYSDWQNLMSDVKKVKMLLEKAFDEYGMHKVYSYVFYKYADEVELLKSAGFSVETILKEEALGENGQYEDIVRLSIFNKA